MNRYIGCHLSATNGYAAMVRTAESIGANTFAFFTRNPRGSKAKAEDPADAAAAMELLRGGHFGPLVAHGAYTMNLSVPPHQAAACRSVIFPITGSSFPAGGLQLPPVRPDDA